MALEDLFNRVQAGLAENGHHSVSDADMALIEGAGHQPVSSSLATLLKEKQPERAPIVVFPANRSFELPTSRLPRSLLARP